MKGLIFLATVALLLTCAGVASAQEVEIEAHPTTRTVEPGVIAAYEVVLKNNMDRLGRFYFFVSGTPSSWINTETAYVQMDKLSSRKLSLDMYPNDDPGNYVYEVFMQSVENPEIIASDKIALVVTGGEPFFRLKSQDIEAGEVEVDFTLVFESNHEKAVSVDFLLESDTGRVVATDTRPLTVDGVKEISHKIRLPDNLVAGGYKAKAKVKDTSISVEESFVVEPFRSMNEVTEETDSPLFKEVRVVVSNEGNDNEKYTLTQSVPTGFITFLQQPTSCEDDECEWNLNLDPYETLEVVYRIEYWPLALEGMVVAVLFMTFVVYTWGRMNNPAITKRLVRKDGDYTAVIEVKNAGNRVTNVVVRDFVTPLFELTGDFESVTPIIKSDESGTELVWSLGALQPREHRLLHYKMKPVINGNLKLSRARMRYLTGTKRSRVYSKDLIVAV